MNIRITPYIFSLIDWSDVHGDPVRKQYLPLKSEMLPDHPMHRIDPLDEEKDSPVPLLTHRYPDKVLFLPLAICPVYCAFCTRSRIVGNPTTLLAKATYGANKKDWDAVFEYIRRAHDVEDVVVSGGDAMMLTPDQIRYIGESLITIPHIRRLRFATKGIAALPQKILTDADWFEAIRNVGSLGSEQGKQVVIHTHFSSSREITEWSRMAVDRLSSAGILVRNQAVLLAGVNDCIDEMILMTRKLSFINVQPYYIYMHDMVPGCEHFRTSVSEGEALAKSIQGVTAGFNTPTFVCDLPGGGGKRPVATYEYYDRENGISVWTAPGVKPGEKFTYFDPLHKLSPEAQARWLDGKRREIMIAEALKKVAGSSGAGRDR